MLNYSGWLKHNSRQKYIAPLWFCPLFLCFHWNILPFLNPQYYAISCIKVANLIFFENSFIIKNDIKKQWIIYCRYCWLHLNLSLLLLKTKLKTLAKRRNQTLHTSASETFSVQPFRHKIIGISKTFRINEMVKRVHQSQFI